MAEAFPSFDYEAARSGRALDVADDFNFAFDVVGKRGREKDKTALIAIERTGETVTHHSYSDLDQLSNRFANALMTLGAEKGDFAFVMIPRIVEWYQVLLGCTKTGVVAKPDEIRGEIVMAYITLAPGFEPSDDLATEIQDFVKRQTVPYKYPRAIEFRDALPKTISGKIRRVELR